MDSKPSNVAIRLPIRLLGALALIAVTLAPAVRSHDSDTQRLTGPANAEQTGSAPIIVAQGRCYNGHCY
jgi:hypothetical protein